MKQKKKALRKCRTETKEQYMKDLKKMLKVTTELGLPAPDELPARKSSCLQKADRISYFNSMSENTSYQLSQLHNQSN